jgi:hypothetical protein
MNETKRNDNRTTQANAKSNAKSTTKSPRGILSFRPAEPIDQIIKLEAASRQTTATQVIADAVARALGGKYRLQAADWRGLLAAERAARLEKERLARWATARAQKRVDRAAQKIAARAVRATARAARTAARAAREERTAARLRLAASGEMAKLLLKTEGVESGQIPDKVHRPFVEHTVFDVPGGDTTPSMPKSPALPVAAQPGII